MRLLVRKTYFPVLYKFLHASEKKNIKKIKKRQVVVWGGEVERNVWKTERNRQKNSFSVMRGEKAIKMQY